MGAARLQSRAAAKVGRRCESLALKYGSKGSRALWDSACDVRRSSQGPEAAWGEGAVPEEGTGRAAEDAVKPRGAAGPGACEP